MSGVEISASGKTHRGKVRKDNEDTMLVDAGNGAFAVLDGMGGAMAGEVASATARDVIAAYVREHSNDMEPRDLIEAAIQAANIRVHCEAKRRQDRHGMGTTVVACMVFEPNQAIVANVGDSRAYLWRDGRIQLLTRDHTVVADLLAKKIITASEAEHHPYNNVLSRNLGSKPRVKIDLVEVSLQPGDRILLCSDGLTGYASTDAIKQLLGGNDSPENIAENLIELALRGGGGDNVTTLIIDAGRAEEPEDTEVIRTSGAMAWWRRRSMFLAAAKNRGLCDSPVCAVLSPDEAVEIVAGNLSEAIYRDLEQTTGINVWTYAENLAKGWFDQEGEYDSLRDLIDILHGAAEVVLADIAAKGELFARGLEIAVIRGLTVAEMAIGGLIAERVRHVEDELVELRARRDRSAAAARSWQGPAEPFTVAADGAESSAGQALIEHPTVPHMATLRVDPAPPEVAECLEHALVRARKLLDAGNGRKAARQFLDRAHMVATEPLEGADFELSGAELVEARSGEHSSISPLLDALDRARRIHLGVVARVDVDREVRVAALRILAGIHRNMMYSIAAAVVESGRPVSEQLRHAAEVTASLRTRVGKGEVKLAALERQLVNKKTTAAGNRAGGQL
ncbi:MAG: Stp1/IreP family PP2C-type Ser/Thr phosphatase [Proteobacteria bacterium]|nr:Stp1/IreP family PP2C-type Ser/Thr phosphatase [Pseudomonadota bacterium]